MPHWKSLHIERFRRLENLRLDELGSVNLLVGKNNSGKTSVLEALAVACHPSSPLNWINTAWERELKSARTPVLEVLNWMFPHTTPRQNGFEGTVAISGVLGSRGGGQAHLMGPEAIRILAEYREFQEVALRPPEFSGEEALVDEPARYAGTMKIRVWQGDEGSPVGSEQVYPFEFRGEKFLVEGELPMLLRHQFVSPVSHRTNQQLLATLDQVLEERRKPQVIELLRRFASDVDDLEIRSPQGRRAVIHLHHRGLGHVPLAMEGDGMRRALAFASAAALAQGGVLLLDEVETALHPEALAGMFRFLVETCRETYVQLFVTTHSLEAVDAMLGSVGDQADGLVAYHLPPRGSDQSVYRLGARTIRSMRSGSGFDLR
jgi:energy-coupling factor transporter ATP-binding protein EcfA2